MKKTLTVLLFFVCFVQTWAQEETKKQFKFDYTIQSKAFGDERKISVYLPPDFYDYPDSKFTVTYILDGHFDPFIDLGVKTIEYNSYMYKYTPTIVVGIHAKERGWEFSAPLPGEEDEEFDYKGGRAPELQQHFKHEVFPLIDSLYTNTLPFRSLIGHSSGGHFVLYTLFSEEKDLFDAYIGISPALRPGENRILEEAAVRLSAGETFEKFLYCSSGTVSEREEIFGGAIQQLDSIFQAHPQHGLIWKKSTFEGMGHWTCVGPSFNTGMVELTRAFRVDEKLFDDFSKNTSQTIGQQADAFYKNCKTKYGFSEIPYGGYLSSIAWDFSSRDKLNAALELCAWGVQQHPEHYRLHKTKAQLELKNGDKKVALATFQKCTKLLEIHKDKMSAKRYESQKEFLQKKIIEAGK